MTAFSILPISALYSLVVASLICAHRVAVEERHSERGEVEMAATLDAPHTDRPGHELAHDSTVATPTVGAVACVHGTLSAGIEHTIQ